jgi:hypothetical protein
MLHRTSSARIHHSIKGRLSRRNLFVLFVSVLVVSNVALWSRFLGNQAQQVSRAHVQAGSFPEGKSHPLGLPESFNWRMFSNLELTSCVDRLKAASVFRRVLGLQTEVGSLDRLMSPLELSCDVLDMPVQSFPLFFSIRNHFDMMPDLLKVIAAANERRDVPFYSPVVIVDATGCHRKFPVKVSRLAEDAYLTKNFSCSLWKEASDKFEKDYGVKIERPRIPWNYADNWNMIREMTLEMGALSPARPLTWFFTRQGGRFLVAIGYCHQKSTNPS